MDHPQYLINESVSKIRGDLLHPLGLADMERATGIAVTAGNAI